MTWNALTDKDREDVIASMPGAIDGFLKGWGWQQFAQAIEARCRELNEIPGDESEFEVYADDEWQAGSSGLRERALAEARNYAVQYLDENNEVRIEEIQRRVIERYRYVQGAVVERS